MSVTLIGPQPATFADLRAVDALMPKPTKTYRPVAHAHLVSEGERIFRDALQMEVRETRLSLAKDGKQMFGVITFHDPERPDVSPAVGLRNAHDKSFALASCGGADVFVCSNMCFSGDAFTVTHKHTSLIMDHLPGLLGNAAAGLADQYRNTVADLDAFHAVPLDLDDGYAELGRMFGRGLLKQRQYTRALDYWRAAPHAEHTAANLFTLYQSVNDALKGSSPRSIMEAHIALHHRAQQFAGRLPVVEPFTDVDFIDVEPLAVS